MPDAGGKVNRLRKAGSPGRRTTGGADGGLASLSTPNRFLPDSRGQRLGRTVIGGVLSPSKRLLIEVGLDGPSRPTRVTATTVLTVGLEVVCYCTISPFFLSQTS